jgi:hypothetical protein
MSLQNKDTAVRIWKVGLVEKVGEAQRLSCHQREQGPGTRSPVRLPEGQGGEGRTRTSAELIPHQGPHPGAPSGVSGRGSTAQQRAPVGSTAGGEHGPVGRAFVGHPVATDLGRPGPFVSTVRPQRTARRVARTLILRRPPVWWHGGCHAIAHGPRTIPPRRTAPQPPVPGLAAIAAVVAFSSSRPPAAVRIASDPHRNRRTRQRRRGPEVPGRGPGDRAGAVEPRRGGASSGSEARRRGFRRDPIVTR